MRLPCFLLALASSSVVFAQSNTVNITPFGMTNGLGRVTFQIADLPTLTGSGAHRGIAYLNDEYYVSHTTAAVTTISVIDRTGVFQRSFNAPSIVATTFGLRDGTSDGNGVVIFGWEGGILFFDSVGNQATTVTAANGPQPVPTTPILSTGGRATHRGLGFDPTGNGGDGSIFISDFGETIQEIALDGTLLFEYPNPAAPDSWVAYGLEVSPDGQSIWVNSAPNQGYIAEYAIDRTTPALTPTGRRFAKSDLGAGLVQGGLAIVPGGADFRNCGYDIVEVSQVPGDITAHRVDLWEGYSSTSEPVLLTGVDLAAPDPATEAYSVIDTATDTTFSVESPQGGILFLNVGPTAGRAPGPLVGFNELTEFVISTNFTPTPAIVSVSFNLPPGVRVPFPVATLPPLPPSFEINAQLVAIDPFVPTGSCGLTIPISVSPVNGFRIIDSTAPKATVTAIGANSFNSDTTSGFFQINNISGEDIARVVMDWSRVENDANLSMLWDPDQGGMADRFDGGDSGTAGCAGTYRNGSDVTTGLIYDANNTASACDAAANTGFILTNNFKRLTFRFSDFNAGELFEFDCDTDFGAGVTGASMVGLSITIETASGALIYGIMEADPVSGGAIAVF